MKKKSAAENAFSAGEGLSAEDMALLAALPGPFLSWFKKNARRLPWRLDREPYHVWLSEIMLQQTRVEAVKAYYLRFIGALPDIKTLAGASEEFVFKLWEGLGYYRRAQNLRKAAQRVEGEWEGVFPSSYAGILALPGIGEYTAGAVASICFGLPKPAVDGNVLRVMARILDSDESVDRPAFRKRIGGGLEGVLAAGDFSPGDFNQSLMEIGATLCLPRGMPNCGGCPAGSFCRALRRGRAELLPVRDVKKARRGEEMTVLILRKRDGGSAAGLGEALALRRRGKDGLLAGMWELPNVPGRLSPDEALALAAAWGVEPLSLERVMERLHVFTHVEWKMLGYEIYCGGEGEKAGKSGVNAAFEWTLAAQREKAYPLPTAFRRFLD